MAIRTLLPNNPSNLTTWIAPDRFRAALVILLTYDFHPIRLQLSPIEYTQLRTAIIHDLQGLSECPTPRVLQALTQTIFPYYWRAQPQASLPWTLMDLWTFCDTPTLALDLLDPRALLHWWRIQRPQALTLEQAHHDLRRILNTDPWRTLPHGLWQSAWPLRWPWPTPILQV